MNRKHAHLSPFEFKDVLLTEAAKYSDIRPVSNAARGNPDFLATIPRHAMIALGEFALVESERSYTFLSKRFGGSPLKKGIVNRWDAYAIAKKDRRGIAFLSAALSYCEANFGIDKDELLYDMVLTYLGCNYPVPPRMISNFETIVASYLQQEMANGGDFDVFATEGGTAAMTYLFQSLKINGLLKKSDKIALATPIFTPYLEIPLLPMYNYQVEQIQTSADTDWQFTQAEIDKLKDPSIKVFCVVNPSNPSSITLNEVSHAMLKDVVDNYNPNLLIVTDDVYGTFSDNFKSIFATIPYNTLLVYSFSKYFGATGWRMGAIALHKDNLLDNLIKGLSEEQKLILDKHYHGLTQDICGIKFIDRLVADSRSVALNHTAGLSLPQQLQMTLFAMSELMDHNDSYKKEAKLIIRRRYNLLYKALGLPTDFDALDDNVGYYTLIEISKIAKAKYGEEFEQYLLKQYDIESFLLKLAAETGVILLPGDGFAVQEALVARVSLANLHEVYYHKIGNLINTELSRAHDSFLANK